jgi:hypothetical protein
VFLSPEGWFDEGHGRGNFVWTPPPVGVGPTEAAGSHACNSHSPFDDWTLEEAVDSRDGCVLDAEDKISVASLTFL